MASTFLPAFATYFLGNWKSALTVETLKRNAEFVSIVNLTTGPQGVQSILPQYEAFLTGAVGLLRATPSRFRLLASIAIDLSLARGCDTARELAEFAIGNDLVGLELSDTRRLEFEYLIAKCLPTWSPADPFLHTRASAFLCRDNIFNRIDRELMYHFTHIVFYLTEFGTKTIDESLQGKISTNCLKLTAVSYLIDDIDLLIESLICLRYLRITPPTEISSFLDQRSKGFEVAEGSGRRKYSTFYHTFLVSCWYNNWRGIADRTEPLRRVTHVSDSLPRDRSFVGFWEVILGLGLYTIPQPKALARELAHTFGLEKLRRTRFVAESLPDGYDFLLEFSGGVLTRELLNQFHMLSR